jgi:hypothetical protein
MAPKTSAHLRPADNKRLGGATTRAKIRAP